jgi:hypothetical protein
LFGVKNCGDDKGTGYREQGTENREQGTENREQGTGNKEQGTGNRFSATLLFVTYVVFFPFTYLLGFFRLFYLIFAQLSQYNCIKKSLI